MEVTEIGPGPEADPGADGGQGRAAVGLVIHPDAGDQIEAAVDPRKTPENVFRHGQVVDQNESLRRVAAEIEADGRPLPENLPGRLALQVQFAPAVAQPDDEGAGDLLAGDKGIGVAQIVEDFLDDLGQALGGDAEEIFRRLQDFILAEGRLGGQGLMGREGKRDNRRQYYCADSPPPPNRLAKFCKPFHDPLSL